MKITVNFVLLICWCGYSRWLLEPGWQSHAQFTLLPLGQYCDGLHRWAWFFAFTSRVGAEGSAVTRSCLHIRVKDLSIFGSPIGAHCIARQISETPVQGLYMCAENDATWNFLINNSSALPVIQYPSILWGTDIFDEAMQGLRMGLLPKLWTHPNSLVWTSSLTFKPSSVLRLTSATIIASHASPDGAW